MRTIVLLSLMGALSMPGGLTAQTVPPLEPGSRVRVSVRRIGSDLLVRKVGSLLAVRRDSLFLKEAGTNDSTVVALTQVSRIEVSRGRRGHTLQGMGIGLLAGAGFGALIGYASGDDEAGFLSFSAGDKAVLGGMGGGILGTLIGAIGGSARTDSWVDVPVRRVNIGLLPTRSRGAGLGVTVTF